MQVFLTSLRALLLMTVLCGLVYPLGITAAGQLLFPYKANGSIIEREGRPVGSELIGQQFAGEMYFSGRPSATGCDAANSAGTNYGAINAKLKEQAAASAQSVREQYGLAVVDPVPAVMVTNSASGLDPHLTPEAVRLQARRVAQARNMELSEVLYLVQRYTEKPALGFIGEERVNILLLNLALDRAQGKA